MSRHCNALSRQRFAGPNAPRPSRLRPPASALTLVEMLVAMAITLIMMAAVVNLFANVGASVRNRRATIEMSGQLRMVRLRLHNDLVGATCPTLTWQRPGDDNGYLEIVEGQWSDKNPSGLIDGNTDNGELDYATSLVPSGGDPQIVIDFDRNDSYERTPDANDVTNGGGLGDYDDILALTVRSEGEPFVGRGRTVMPGGDPTNPDHWIVTTIESTLGEVVWFAVENPVGGTDEPGMRTVYRRVLLIAPWSGTVTRNVGGGLVTGSDPILNLSGYAAADRPAELLKFQADYDISVRLEGDRLVPNTLGDLTKRENRYAHVPAIFPHVFPYYLSSGAMVLAGPNSSLMPLSVDRLGEDVMLSDVLAFDVRVYDPGVPLQQDATTGTILEPSDAGWGNTATAPIGFGGFADLFWLRRGIGVYSYTPPLSAPVPLFSALPAPRSMLVFPNTDPPPTTYHPSVTYDTWSFHYENDGLDQDNRDNDNDVTTGADEGTNGLDDDNRNGVDDMGERETAPPYDVPLRGLQVKLRVYEPDTRNIRETTVTRNFVP